MSKRREKHRDFVELCDSVGFHLEPFQKRVSYALLGPEREKLITLPRKNGKSRLIGAFAAWHLLRTPNAQAIVVANSKEQAEIIDRYARQVAMHPAVEQEFEPRFRELRGPDGSTLQVKSADAGRLLGQTPTLAVYDEFCVAKDDAIYTALRSALLPGSTMFTVTTAGVGVGSPLGRLRARALGGEVRRKGCFTDARADGIRMLEWMVPEDVGLGAYHRAKQANPLSLITREWLREQRTALHELDYQRFHLNRWVAKIGSWAPAGAWQSCADPNLEIEPGEDVWVGVDVGGSRADSAVVWATQDLRIGCEIFSGEDAVMDVAELVPQLAERFNVVRVACDPWRTGQMMREWEERGGFEVFEFPQTDNRMIPASQRLYDAVTEGRLRHPDSDRLNQHAAAAIARHGRRGWRIDKVDLAEKIDGITAAAIAVDLVSRHRPQPEPKFHGFI